MVSTPRCRRKEKKATKEVIDLQKAYIQDRSY